MTVTKIGTDVSAVKQLLASDKERAELIAARAVSALTYKSVASIIDQQTRTSSRDNENAIIEHPNLRGPGYFH